MTDSLERHWQDILAAEETVLRRYAYCGNAQCRCHTDPEFRVLTPHVETPHYCCSLCAMATVVTMKLIPYKSVRKELPPSTKVIPNKKQKKLKKIAKREMK